MNRYLYFPLLALTACTTEPSTYHPGDDGEHPPVGPTAVPGMETQGRYVLGEHLDRLPGLLNQHVSAGVNGTQNGSSVTVEFYGAAALRIVGTNQIADNVSLPTPGGEFQLTLAANLGSVLQYNLRYRDNKGVSIDPCNGAQAVPLYGTFTLQGLHEDTSNRVSFACADGVAYKCTDWGYAAGSSRATDAWQVHQACTRMARFDVCARGAPATIEGTYIAIFDTLVVNPQPAWVYDRVTQWPPPPNDFYFEAGWRGESLPAVCLSKVRWSRFPAGDLCGGALKDPRLDPSAKYCDDYPGGAEDITAQTGAKLFSGSRYNDLAMHMWRDGADRVSTIDGYYADPSTMDMLHPYQSLGSYGYEHAEGLLIRSLPASASTSDFENVYLYENGPNELVLATEKAAAAHLTSHTKQGWRGMVFNKPANTRLPLELYVDTSTGDAVTTTGGSPGSSYALRGTIGHIPALETPP